MSTFSTAAQARIIALSDAYLEDSFIYVSCDSAQSTDLFAGYLRAGVDGVLPLTPSSVLFPALLSVTDIYFV